MHKREFLDPLTEKGKKDPVPGLSVYPCLLSMSGPNYLLPTRLIPAAGKRVEVSQTALSAYYLQLRNLRGKSYVLLTSLHKILKRSLVVHAGACAQPWANCVAWKMVTI